MRKRPQSRSRTFNFPTPKLADVLVIEERDLGIEKEYEYGEAHSDTLKYPHHKLIFVEPIEDESNPDALKSRWYYAADREHQEEYNWEVTFPYSGLTTCPRINRTYVLPRKGYEAARKGSLDPYSRSGDEFALFLGAELVYEETKRISPPFDSLYITVVRIFEKVPTVNQQLAVNAEITYQGQGDTTVPRITRRFVVKRSEYAAVAKGTADPTYTSAVLVQQNQLRFSDELADSRYVLDARVYETLLRSEITRSSLEINQGIPDKFLYSTTVEQGMRNFLASGATLGEITVGNPAADLAELKRSLVPDGDLERALSNIEYTRMLFDKRALHGWRLEERTGQLLPYTIEVVPEGTAGSAPDATGEYTEVEPISPFWSLKTTQKTTGMAATGPDGENAIRWTTHEHYSWPRVLKYQQFIQASSNVNQFFKEPYSGRCRVDYAEWWQATAPTVPDPSATAMVPTNIQLSVPGYSYSLPECLHAAFRIKAWFTIDPSSAPGVIIFTYTWDIPATNYTDWPPYIQEYEVSPERGGFMCRVRTIYSPTVSYSIPAPVIS